MAEHFSLKVTMDSSSNFLLFDSNSFKNLAYLGICTRTLIKGRLMWSCLKSSRDLPNYLSTRSFFYFCRIRNLRFVLLHRLSEFTILLLLFILINSFLLALLFSILNSLPLLRDTSFTCSLGLIPILLGKLTHCLLEIKLASYPI